MNAQTYNQVVSPVFAVLTTSKHHQRHTKKQLPKKNTKKDFDLFLETACDYPDEMLTFNDAGCYGKDAKPVVRMVSSFNRTL